MGEMEMPLKRRMSLNNDPSTGLTIKMGPEKRILEVLGVPHKL